MDNIRHLEKFALRKDHRLVDRIDHKGAKIVLTEGGPYFERKTEYPLGFYETAYWVFKDEKVVGGQVLEFEYLHDIKSQTTNTRPMARLNSTKKAAKEFVEIMEKKIGHR